MFYIIRFYFFFFQKINAAVYSSCPGFGWEWAHGCVGLSYLLGLNLNPYKFPYSLFEREIRESKAFMKNLHPIFPSIHSCCQFVMILFYLQIIEYYQGEDQKKYNNKIKLNLFLFLNSFYSCISLYCFFSLQT